MGKWEETYSEENPLREALRNARQAGGLNGGQDRVQFIGPLLDAIVNQSCKWTSDQCARFLEKLLRKYVENEDLELLLATFGFGSNYKNLKIISMRRKKFLDDYPGKYNHSDSALKKREDKQVDRIVRFLELDHKNNESRLAKQLLVSVLSDQDLEMLKIRGIDLLKESGSNSDGLLKRAERISNICPTNGKFIGRADVLQALKDGFKAGYHVQMIGSGQGFGKSRLALEYASLHASEYRIICWINAWDECCITSSILNFLDMAKIPYKDVFPDRLSELFWRFFNINTEWLLIFDNARVTKSDQLEMLKKYMPQSRGHIIVTGQFVEELGIDDYKYYLMHRVSDKETDYEHYFKTSLSEGEVDTSVRQLVSTCQGNHNLLMLVTSYIQQSNWVDCATYLHMLEDRGIGTGSNSLVFSAGAAFEIKMSAVHIGQKYLNDTICSAIYDFLMISSIFGQIDFDLMFFHDVFPIFPEPLNTVCDNGEMRKRLIESLKGFGFFELRENVLHGNDWLTVVIGEYFRTSDTRNLCSDILDIMETNIRTIRANWYIDIPDAIIARASPYIDRACWFMCETGTSRDDELNIIKGKCPNVFGVISRFAP